MREKLRFGSKVRRYTITLAGIVALALGAGCGDDSEPAAPGGGAGGDAGSAGTAAGDAGTGGNAGTGGDAGTGGGTGGTAGNGGDASAGSSGTGGTVGTGGEGGSGGTAGMDGGASLCGNGTVDPGEGCDDGNTVDFDGCSSVCNAKCETCEAKYCKPPETIEDLIAIYLQRTDVTNGGPAPGTPKKELLLELTKCIRQSGCLVDRGSADDSLDVGDILGRCYCGDGITDSGQCAGSADPKGPCVKEVEAAAETRDVGSIVTRWIDDTYAAGRAQQILRECEFKFCPKECLLDTPSDECDRCLLKGPFLSELTSTSYPECFAGDQRDLCRPVFDCIRQSGCGAAVSPSCSSTNNCGTALAESCYGSGSGPCARAIETAAGSTDQAEVTRRVVAPYSQISGGFTLARAVEHASALFDRVMDSNQPCRNECLGGANDGG